MLTGLLSRRRFTRSMNARILPKDNTVEYCFVEPVEVRNREIKSKLKIYIVSHFSLAFQGGGAKGVAYLGAYQALRHLYPNTPIKSIIGSSAGGMLALAMAAGASVSELKAVCEDMVDVPRDRTVMTLDEAKNQEAYLHNIRLNIRDLLSSLGIIHESMFDILADSIFTDEVLDKLVKFLYFFSGKNESVRQMFTIDVEEEETVRGDGCCRATSEKRKVHKYRLINMYGLLEGKLMSGRKIEEIALKIITTFLKLQYKECPQEILRIFKIEKVPDSDRGWME